MNPDIIIHPSRAAREKAIPSCGILFVNPTEARVALQTLVDRGGEQRFLFHSGLVVSPDNDFFVAGPALGAPMAAMVLEKLIVLGAEKVVMTGWCGAVSSDLRVGDTIFGGVGYSGEGTSQYYTGDDVSEPSSRLLASLKAALGMGVTKVFWSTDAPYRESRKMLQALAERYKVSAVDMEYSALCAVAAFRKIDFAAVFLVSDELWKDEWRPGFTGKVFKRKSKAQIKQLMQHIVSLSILDEV
ncbi:MAG TPA: uridine phosphorylase [Desulfocapsa sulfexigens]|nr:uridine phosphorylase [Desulfocapsa sulfexigens]HIQ37520.1 uridine phosphorylase [Desulfocapsa sulfexigens]